MFKGKATMPVLNRDDILDANDIQIELVSVPEWGGDVFVKGMTGAERDRFEAGVISLDSKSEKVDMRDIRAKLCSETICDEAGKKLFNHKGELALKVIKGISKNIHQVDGISGATITSKGVSDSISHWFSAKDGYPTKFGVLK